MGARSGWVAARPAAQRRFARPYFFRAYFAVKLALPSAFAFVM
jgi:hypothetical protein